MIPPLAIVQARMASTRLPGKVLLPLAGKPLIWHAWNAAVTAFGVNNVAIAIPSGKANDELEVAVLSMDMGVNTYRWDGPEQDVLGRFWKCAHLYRWHPDSIIVRITPDDPRKDPKMLQRVAAGERLPVELGGEAFTLAMLDAARRSRYEGKHIGVDIWEPCEHLTHAIFPTPPPPPPPGIWTVDTPEDYEAMKREMEGSNLPPLGDISGWLEPGKAIAPDGN